MDEITFRRRADGGVTAVRRDGDQSFTTEGLSGNQAQDMLIAWLAGLPVDGYPDPPQTPAGGMDGA